MFTAVLQKIPDPEINNNLANPDTFKNPGLCRAGGRYLPEKPGEACLIEAALAGDLPAFNQLVEMYQDSLYWWVLFLAKDDDLADDITQSTFISAYEKLASFRGGSFRAWLFKIARNRCYDELRRKKRFPLQSLEGSPEDEFDRLAALPDRSQLPEDALIATEQAANIERLLNSLPAISQQVLRLVDMEGMDYQEASAILGLPLGTIKSRLARARWRLRQIYQE